VSGMRCLSWNLEPRWSLDIPKNRKTIPQTRSGAAREGKKGFQGKETVGCRSGSRAKWPGKKGSSKCNVRKRTRLTCILPVFYTCRCSAFRATCYVLPHAKFRKTPGASCRIFARRSRWCGPLRHASLCAALLVVQGLLPIATASTTIWLPVAKSATASAWWLVFWRAKQRNFLSWTSHNCDPNPV
jgi:hypothetical protein